MYVMQWMATCFVSGGAGRLGGGLVGGLDVGLAAGLRERGRGDLVCRLVVALQLRRSNDCQTSLFCLLQR